VNAFATRFVIGRSTALCLLVAAIGSFAPFAAVAQPPAAAAGTAHNREVHADDHRDRGDRSVRGRPEGKLAEQERDDRRLLAAYKERLKDIDAAVKKATLDRLLELRRRQQADHPAHIAANATSIGDVQSGTPHHQGPVPNPVSIKTAMKNPPQYPHDGQSAKPALLGGAALYDAKNGAFLDGATIRRKP
jgi:hypothetical protein